MSRKKKKNVIVGAFVVHSLEMRASPAWQHLPDCARRILDCLEVEHLRHGGAENGFLAFTHKQFAQCGIRYASVALAVRQCARLGFLDITQRGGMFRSSFRSLTTYRLTYLNGCGRSPDPTHDWRSIKTPEAALAALAQAAADKNYSTQPRTLTERRAKQAAEKQNSGSDNATDPDAKTRPVAA